MPAWLIITFGLLKVTIWTGGFGYALWRRRWAVGLGFGLAAYLAALRAIDDVGRPGTRVADQAAILGTIVAGLFVGGFVDGQLRSGGGRPRRWTL
jgi:hypothetical protein